MPPFEECKALEFSGHRKPTDKTDEGKAAGEEFKKFRDEVAKRYKAIKGDIEEREFELSRFLKSGEVASAFLRVIFKFDEEYAAVKLDENKLDCDDLEHLTVKLLENEEILKEIKSKYTCVFVDE